MPQRPTSRNLSFARKLRAEMTYAEGMLWRALRDRRLDGHKFRRQVPIGRYIADFLCEAHKLIVELDGPPHDDPGQQAHDNARDAWLHAQGYFVLRLPNDLVIGGGNMPLERIRTELARLILLPLAGEGVAAQR